MFVEGRIFDGKTSASQKATLYIDEAGRVTSRPEIVQSTTFSSLIISGRIGNTPRTISFPSGETFETSQHDNLDFIIEKLGGKSDWLHKLESKLHYVFIALILTISFVAWSSIWGIPWLSTQNAYAMPIEVNEFITQGTMETLDERIFDPSELDEYRKRELTERFQQIIPVNNSGFNYNLLFRGGGFIGANAFALPDGTVVVTDELIELAHNDDEIISVMLHEIGHVEHRHGLQSVLSHIGLSALVLSITGDVNSAGALVLALPNVLLESSYSRDLEWEADTYSLEHMRQHNIDPEHFANFMERLAAYDFEDMENDSNKNDIDIIENKESEEINPESSWLDYMSSHPPSAERAARFRNTIP